MTCGVFVHVLIVDDDPVVLENLSLLLTDQGHQTTLARDGREALQLMDKTVPDVVISDIQMPNLDGIDLLKAIRKQFSDLPVVLMTGYGTLETAVEALRGQALDYLKKPIQMDDLASCLRRLEGL